MVLGALLDRPLSVRHLGDKSVEVVSGQTADTKEWVGWERGTKRKRHSSHLREASNLM